MPIWRLQVEWLRDSAFPRDRMVITPHFNDAGVTTDPDQLCQDLLDGLQGWDNSAGELKVTAYDAQGTPPVFPAGDAIVNQGVVETSAIPREIALCLSFYGTRNLPRQRGRLFLPASLFVSSPGLRPSAANMQKAADLVPILTGLGGVDVDWCVFSRATQSPHSVTHWWVDDEWDTIRSRGLRGDTRLTGTTSEG